VYTSGNYTVSGQSYIVVNLESI